MTDNTAPSMDELTKQATIMANQGGPGANAPAAESWLEQQAKKYGYNLNTGGMDPSIIGSIGKDGTFTPNPNNPEQQQQIGSGAAVSNGVANWVQSHAANYGLVVLGALLALGALLISQRQTIVQVGKIAAEVAA
jgi:hypothetical protein